MRRIECVRILRLIIVAAFAGMAGVGCSNNSYSGKIIAVQYLDGKSGTPENAQLIVIDPDAPQKEARLLSEDFVAAASPSLSHDGRFLLFQGKKNDSDPWQIWMADLNGNSFIQVTDLQENCTEPVPLPDETIVFSRENKVNGYVVNDLWRCGMDGCCLTRITYNPSRNVGASVLSEGRILYLSSQQFPDPKTPVLMIMRPDGTKSELYTPGCCGWNPVSGGSESADGYIYFIAAEGKLSRVMHRRPLHTFENLSEGITGLFSAVTTLPDGGCLVSYKPSSEDPFGIYRYGPDSSKLPELVYQGKTDISDPLWIEALDERPRKLPSAVNPENPTGLLMSQNINHSMLPAHSDVGNDTLANSVRVSYLNGNEEVIEVEEDGSFYLKMDTEEAFRIETLNNTGETVRGPSDWIYLRPNERRACTGCHADPELAPENIQPLAVKKDPVEVYVKKNEVSN